MPATEGRWTTNPRTLHATRARHGAGALGKPIGAGLSEARDEEGGALFPIGVPESSGPYADSLEN